MALDYISIFLFVLPSPLSNLCSEGWAKIVFQAWRWFFLTRQIIRQMLIEKPGLKIHNFKAFPPEEEQGNEPKGEKSPKDWNKTSRVLVEIAPGYLICQINPFKFHLKNSDPPPLQTLKMCRRIWKYRPEANPYISTKVMKTYRGFQTFYTNS